MTVWDLRNAGKDTSSNIDGRKQVKRWAAKMSELWNHLLQDDVANSPNSDTARHLLFAGLRGLADEINPHARVTRNSWLEERAALAEAIAHLLLSRRPKSK